ncbi:MAG: hypothetical protein ACU85E_17355, partial [Gammaproteobacteria bacterium]
NSAAVSSKDERARGARLSAVAVRGARALLCCLSLAGWRLAGRGNSDRRGATECRSGRDAVTCCSSARSTSPLPSIESLPMRASRRTQSRSCASGGKTLELLQKMI